MVRPRVPWDLLSALYSIILTAGAIVVAIIAAGPLDVIVGPAVWSALLGLLVAAIGLVYGLTGRNAAISTMALILGALISGGQVARVLDFVTKATGFPLADAWLARWDARLGLDWRAYHDWMLQHAQLAMMLGVLYRPTQLFVAATVIVLTVKNLHREAATFALAIVISLLICVVVGGSFRRSGLMAISACPTMAPPPGWQPLRRSPEVTCWSPICPTCRR
jgi:hypothetical protein